MLILNILFIAVIIVNVSQTNAFGSVDELIDSYARTKLWESCVGGGLAREWEKRVDEVSLECRREGAPLPEDANSIAGRGFRDDRHFHREERRAFVPHRSRSAPQRSPRVFVTNAPQNHWFNVPLVANRRVDTALLDGGPSGSSGGGQLLRSSAKLNDGRVQPVWFTLFDQIPIIIQPAPVSREDMIRRSRQRRSTDKGQFEVFLQNMVDSERSVRERLANFTCVLQTLGLVDSRGDLDYSVMEESTRNAALDVELRNDFLGILDDCTRVSRCESYKSHVVPAQLQRAFAFFRCARDRRQMACLKRDLRGYLRANLQSNSQGHRVDLEDMVDRIFYVTMAEMGHREIKNMLLV